MKADPFTNDKNETSSSVATANISMIHENQKLHSQLKEMEGRQSALAIDPNTITISPRFQQMYDWEPEKYENIKASMKKNGYNPAKPIVVWKEGNILIDGHHRLTACMELEIEVLVVYLSFESEEEAYNYGLLDQLMKRNLTEGGKIKTLLKMDLNNLHGTGKKKEKVAKIANWSATKAQTFLNLIKHKHGSLYTQKIIDGELTISGAWKQLEEDYPDENQSTRKKRKSTTKKKGVKIDPSPTSAQISKGVKFDPSSQIVAPQGFIEISKIKDLVEMLEREVQKTLDGGGQVEPNKLLSQFKKLY